MYLVMPVQVSCGQFGVSFFRILWRCLLIGAWPVRSWVSMLICLRLSQLVIFRYWFDGSEGSICFILFESR